ncbi:hypothetical protein GA565_01515 [Rouxiella sp. S1S-2]|uniref:hypothetical protein n=1 Tax=Rouxiella sp. S1S-2 TaxID=2653856 RepID=UPI001263FAC2|nr:hypothetical protein [Rouxiella sp. S1S-2]KAB7894761.1 hypothetical protein GA565_01515 [Rouxiella sp. S1S-2]
MKKIFPLSAIIIIVIVAVTVWRLNRTPAHNPHYDATTCAAVDILGKKPVDDKALLERVRYIITNENNSYAVDQVKYNEDLAKVSVKRYQALSTQQKTFAGQNIDSCIQAMTKGAADKTNQ